MSLNNDKEATNRFVKELHCTELDLKQQDLSQTSIANN